jgi:hypothetical protein
VLRPDEQAWVQAKQKLGARSPLWVLVSCALDAADYWPSDEANDSGRGAVLALALRALLHAAAHGFTLRSARDVLAARVCGTTIHTSMGFTASFCALLLRRALCPDLLALARAAADEGALRALLSRLEKLARDDDDDGDDDDAKSVAAPGGAAGTAPLVLRRCALAACSALEPRARAFRVCSGLCGGAACYCSREHQMQDWKRHRKAGDGCGLKPAA